MLEESRVPPSKEPGTIAPPTSKLEADSVPPDSSLRETHPPENAPTFEFDHLRIHPSGVPPWDETYSTPAFPNELGLTFHKLATFEVGYGYLTNAILSDDGKLAAVISDDSGLLSMYSVDEKTKLAEVRYPEFAQFDGIALANAGGNAFFFAGKRGIFGGLLGESELIPLRGTPATELYSNPAARFLFSVERSTTPQSGTAKLTTTGPGLSQLEVGAFDFDARPDGIAFAKNGALLAVSYYPPNRVFLYDIRNEKTLGSFAAPEFGGSVALTADGKYLAVSGAELWLYDTANGERIAVGEKYGNNIDTVLFSPDERLLVTSSYEGKIRVYPFTPENEKSPLGKPQILRHRGTANVYGLGFSADGRRMVSGSGDKTLIVWERDATKSKKKKN